MLKVRRISEHELKSDWGVKHAQYPRALRPAIGRTAYKLIKGRLRGRTAPVHRQRVMKTCLAT